MQHVVVRAQSKEQVDMYFKLYVVTALIGLTAYGLYLSTSGGQATAVGADLPTTITISICGDGISNAGEVCDTGYAMNDGGYGSSTAERRCNADCTAYGPYCGDGIFQARYTEQCDDNNNVSGDLCSAACLAEVPQAPPPTPTFGNLPASGGVLGTTPASLATRVVLRGKAFPNVDVNILLDGEELSTARADANGEFFYSTESVTPGTATFGFWANDPSNVRSITQTVVFDVVQSAVSTVANILIPPTISLSGTKVPPGQPITMSGFSVPLKTVNTLISDEVPVTLNAETQTNGAWTMQIDTNSLAAGFHSVKARVSLTDSEKSGYGRAINFYVGTEDVDAPGDTDLNIDGKVNLVDFSIFLTGWGKTESRFDFNNDQKVNLADFSILLFNWTG